jgi:DNA-directed RNA polymerase sigma subunit (sigma70/sigma32)
MLSPEREQDLALAWRGHGDEAALRDLVGSHLRLVIKIARGFAGYGLPVSDLIAEANVGLMQAAQKFDPDRGFRFCLRDVVDSRVDPGTHPAFHLVGAIRLASLLRD